MTARMTRSAPQSPFELPEVRAVVCATRLSCQNAGKAQKFTPVRGSSGKSRFNLVCDGQRTYIGARQCALGTAAELIKQTEVGLRAS